MGWGLIGDIAGAVAHPIRTVKSAVGGVKNALYGNSLDPTSTAQTEEDRQRNLAAYQSFLDQSNQYKTTTPIIDASTASGAQPVAYNDPGPIERVDNKNRDVTLSPDAQGVDRKRK